MILLPRRSTFFPTRRSSDLWKVFIEDLDVEAGVFFGREGVHLAAHRVHLARDGLDRKSTRLNSSHVAISYAVFCLKKKKKRKNIHKHTTTSSQSNYKPINRH